jgi:hypothetical protein
VACFDSASGLFRQAPARFADLHSFRTELTGPLPAAFKECRCSVLFGRAHDEIILGVDCEPYGQDRKQRWLHHEAFL